MMTRRIRQVGRRLLTYASDSIRIGTAGEGTGVYVGPRVPGNLNLGDNLLFWAHQHSLPDIPLRQVHTFPRFLAPRSVQRLRGIVLGGGTLIGSPSFRHGLQTAVAALPDLPVVNIGTGVDDPVMPSTGRPGDDAELRAWVDLLRRLRTVWVRGPLSQRLLHDLDVPAEISGDPVLLFALDTDLRARPMTGQVGINLGITGNQWQQRPEELVRAVTEYGRMVQKDGLEVLLISVWDSDDAVTASVARDLGCEAILAPQLRTAGAMRRVMKRLDLLVAQKLHAVVGAACVATPAIALEYRPKCRDFQESIGMGRWVIRTSDATAEALMAMTRELYDARAGVVGSLARMVAQRRAAVGRAASDAYEVLSA